MKKLRKIFVNAIACLLLLTGTISLTACEDVKKVQVTFVAGETEYTVDVDFYRHLAPKTCYAILDLINDGYYDNTVLFTNNSTASQVMLGEFKLIDGVLTQNVGKDGKLPAEMYGEFEKNGTVGSNLTNTTGAIGVWRSWYEENDLNYQNTSEGMNSARGVWYMPTTDITTYNGYFCIFAKFSVADNESAFDALSNAFSSTDDYTSYVVYYTGEYDATKEEDNYGLTFHSLTKEEYDKLDKTTVNNKVTINNADGTKTDVFSAEGAQLECYNLHTVKVPNDIVIKKIAVK